MATLALCLPQGDQVEADYCNGLAAMILNLTSGSQPHGIDEIAVVSRRGSLVMTVRNEIARQALDLGADYLLWIDDDHIFPPDTGRRLLDRELPYVGINATTRGYPIRYTAWSKPGHMLITDDNSKGVQPVWRMGFGLCLLRREVFEKVEEPWFATPYVRVEDTGETYFQGEDIYFCDAAKEAGFTPHVDHELTRETEHIASVGRTHHDVDADVLSKEYGATLRYD